MLRPTACAVALLGLAGLCATAFGAEWVTKSAAPDAVLSRSYGAALGDTDTAWTTRPPNIWLSGLAGTASAGKALAAGDSITIASKDGRPDTIEVIELESVSGEPIGLPGVRFQLVTGRSRTQVPGTVVRFLFASETPGTMPPLRTPADRLL